MTKVIIIDESYDEIESTTVNSTLHEVFSMALKVPYIHCGADRLRQEIKEISSIDFKEKEITIMICFNPV